MVNSCLSGLLKCTVLYMYKLIMLNYTGERNDVEELGRLLQLILGCAVNCANKEEYIGKIMSMEESVQHVVMNAIQEVRFQQNYSYGISPVGQFDQQRMISLSVFLFPFKLMTKEISAGVEGDTELGDQVRHMFSRGWREYTVCSVNMQSSIVRVLSSVWLVCKVCLRCLTCRAVLFVCTKMFEGVFWTHVEQCVVSV